MSRPRWNQAMAGLVMGAVMLMGAGCNPPPAPPGPTPPAATGSPATKGSPPASASPAASGSPVSKATPVGPGSPAIAPSGMGAIPPTGTPDPAHVIHAFISDTEMKPRVFILPADQTQSFAFKNTGAKPVTIRLEGEGIKRETTEAIQPGKEMVLDGNLAAGTYKLSIPGQEGKDAFVGQVTVK